MTTWTKTLLPGMILLATARCGDGGGQEARESAAVSPGPVPASESSVSIEPGTIEVVTFEYGIDVPETMSLGWNTFRFTNRGQQAHFVYMYRIADGKTIEDQLAEVVPPFDAMLRALQSGEIGKNDIGSYLADRVPEWGFQMNPVGGAGLLSPGATSSTTFKIDTPGTYLVECYVKSPEGLWHTSMGMLREVSVADGPGGGKEPAAEFEITVGDDGVSAPMALDKGSYIFRIGFLDTPDALLPYDLHLARLAQNTDIAEVTYWMDWANVGGFRAPAPVTFLGGVENMRAGNHGYLQVDLEPGRYLWISETFPERTQQVFEVH